MRTHERALGTMLALGCTLPGCYQGLGAGPGAAADDPAGEDSGQPDATSGGDEGPAASCLDAPATVGVGGMRLLTRYEYDNTIRDLLGDDTAPAAGFVRENQTTAFENNGVDHKVSAELVRQYMDASEGIAARAVQERLTSLLPCEPAAAGCGHAFVDAFLPRAFRRPVEAHEREAFTALFDAGAAEHGFADAVGLVIQAALQSPQFLYRIEYPPADAAADAVVPVTGHDMASRLSYFLLASMPDAELFAAAEAGELETRAGVEAHARRLLDSEAGRRSVRQFHRQWLGLSSLRSVGKDPALYPALEPATMGADWQDSVERFSEHVFFDAGGTIAELLGSDAVFMSPALAAAYPDRAIDAQTGAFTLPGAHAGLLSQPGLMAQLAHADGSSPVARGVFVRTRLLCQHLPPPPNDVPIEPPDPDPNATTRERFAQHTADPQCAGCHQQIDPIGFGFENFDAIGAWRTEENGLPIDASGELTNLVDPSQQGPFDGVEGLAAKLGQSTDFSDCVAHQWTTFALGREPDEADACSVETIRRSVGESGGDLRELLIAIATSDAFRHRIADGGAP